MLNLNEDLLLLMYIFGGIAAVLLVRGIVILILSGRVRIQSSGYKRIHKLNEEYGPRFNMDLQERYTYRVALNSKQQFDRFNFGRLLPEVLRESEEEWANRFEICKYNEQIFDEYCEAVDEVYEEELVGEVSGFFDLYKKREEEMCHRSLLTEPVMGFEIECSAHYVSPAGRNCYEKEWVFDYDDVLEAYEMLEQRAVWRQTGEYQRSIMTPSLRYDIMKRDGFRCVLCGRDAYDGVRLHVDHIVPVSNGGQTVPWNLRTLCEECNLGKGDKEEIC